jgi:hypothetical protein
LRDCPELKKEACCWQYEIPEKYKSKRIAKKKIFTRSLLKHLSHREVIIFKLAVILLPVLERMNEKLVLPIAYTQGNNFIVDITIKNLITCSTNWKNWMIRLARFVLTSRALCRVTAGFRTRKSGTEKERLGKVKFFKRGQRMSYP